MARFRSKTRAYAFEVQRNYNRKITRLEKLGKNTNLLPKKITNDEMVELINSQKSSRDLNRQLKQLERFTRRGGEKLITYEGEEMLKADKENLLASRRSALARLRSELSNELTKIGNAYSVKDIEARPQLANFLGHDIQNATAKITTIKNSKGTGSVRELTRMFDNYSRDTNKWKDFRDNFIEMMVETAYTYGIEHAEVSEMVKELKKLTGRQFAKMYRQNTWVEGLIHGYHLTMEYMVDDLLNNPMYKDQFMREWDDMKAHFKIAIEESKNE